MSSKVEKKPRELFPWVRGSCFVEVGRKRPKILLFERHKHKPSGGKWCTPSRRVERGESVKRAVARAVASDLGIDERAFKIKLGQVVYLESPGGGECVEHHLFRVRLPYRPEIKNHNHKDFSWMSPRQALLKDLVEELPTCIQEFYRLP